MVVRGVVVDDGHIESALLALDCILEGEKRFGLIILTTVVLCDLAGLAIANKDQNVEVAELGDLDGLAEECPLALALYVDALRLVLDDLFLLFLGAGCLHFCLKF